jgi:hypothetical protein
MLEELHSQGVVAAKTIMQKREGALRKTNSIIVTFGCTSLPTFIYAGYLKVKVDPFIPSPLRCFKCQKFGHHVSNCKSEEQICAKCSLSGHEADNCGNPVKCLNCQGNHPAYFNTCPTWKMEKEVCRVKTLQNVSYPEARKIINSRKNGPCTAASYAQAAQGKTEMKTIGTQTDIVLCLCKPANVLQDTLENQNPISTKTTMQSSLNNTNRSTSQKNPPNSPPAIRGQSISPRGRAGRSHARRQTINLTNLTKEQQSSIRLTNRFEGLETEEVEMADPSLKPGKSKPPLTKITAPT